MQMLTFVGTYSSGASRFAKEIDLSATIGPLKEINGWPHSLVPGTFNIDIDESNWPVIPDLDFNTSGVGCLDRSHSFPPVVYLDYSVVPKNTLNPEKSGEFGGDLQFWRAIMRINQANEPLNCYMMRRVRSGYRTKIEVVSDVHISTKYELVHGHAIELRVLAQ
jgi:hypothetical protein